MNHLYANLSLLTDLPNDLFNERALLWPTAVHIIHTQSQARPRLFRRRA
jgi:hypothetical protein